MEFWDIIWYIIVCFAFIAYLIMLWMIISDLFRNREQSGWVKAIWIVFLFIIPWLTALVYLIVHGDGMAKRSAREAAEFKSAQDNYIREVAGEKSAAEHIADAKALLDSGTITEDEFQALKAKALA
ncbi:phospholipase D-like protein [Rhodococcus sp. SMB37]|uniref:SHOCT domain-containing protein n=1 Tax=Rhodococcus sp. SMB37 TaxID=2512213 RepID=UPI0006CF8967|nr:SHOCT domain-containing protein [Rhodococcus sp. SMB37]TCN48999.1 phospholipase D-like protein [Rhodococcus sp. SMB37]